MRPRRARDARRTGGTSQPLNTLRTLRASWSRWKRGERTELPVRRDHNGQQRFASDARCHAEHPGNERARLVCVAQADCIDIHRVTRIADGDVVVANADIGTGIRAERDVVAAARIPKQRGCADGGIGIAGRIVCERTGPARGVIGAGVAVECHVANCGVAGADGV